MTLSTSNSNCVPFLIDADLWELGVTHYRGFSPEVTPHLMLTGQSGSGKTYCLLLLLARLARHRPNARFIVADYKNSGDFSFLASCKGAYYFHSAVYEAVELAYNELQYRLRNGVEGPELYLVVDELSAFILSSERSVADLMRNRLGELILLGRGCSIRVVSVHQRPDSDAFRMGARDQYSVVLGLGRISHEHAKMIGLSEFGEVKSEGRGRGYLRVDGAGTFRVIVPRIRDINRVRECIASRLWVPEPVHDGAGGA